MLGLAFLFSLAIAAEANWIPPTGPVWTWKTSQELYHSFLDGGNVTECEWSLQAENVVSYGSQSRRGNVTGYGFCARNMGVCIHFGTIPRPVTDRFKGLNCTVCCARRSCMSYPSNNDDVPPQNGYCMLPKLQTAAPPVMENGATIPLTGPAPFYASPYATGTGFSQDAFHDEEEQTCLNIGGAFGSDNATWWAGQCPMSGRCCLYPQTVKCETCGGKYGKEWNWSKPAMARSDTQDEMLAWKTAVNQMAGTGWNLGMQPVATPGFAEQYSQIPPTYDSLVPPQLWNNFLNRPNAAIKKISDDTDEDDHRGWCWQAAILSKLDGSLRCGGALIGERMILTTASCASFTSESFSNYGVRLGGTDLRKGDEKHAVDLDIAEVFIHPQYNASNWSNNIAIIELKSAVDCNNKYICTICLPSVSIMGFTNFSPGTWHNQWIREDLHQCLVTGWGRKTAGLISYTPYLKEMIYAPIFNNQTFCQAEYLSKDSGYGGSEYGSGAFCAVPQPTVDAKLVPLCQGDNGGPLACLHEGRYYLTGLTWGGNKCDHMGKANNIVAKVLQPNYKGDLPGTYVDFFTDVVKFIPWIYSIIYDVV